ncbi:ParA family protein [Pseudomonas sp. LPH60]|uniref:ParA family protein n=1 Tax=Pseudomonas sp. LPH60 TaxID=3065906 RepID=UPI00273A9B26|nr:ParA family protein [Pseudomonas sp. LPH60]MDP4573462.1 ParA family protein [Pseudomonas sp. LPH60]
MKTYVLANQKGGVGKSFFVVQFAYFLHILRGLRVLVIDLDHQRNSTKAIKLGGYATVSSLSADALLRESALTIENAEFVLVSGTQELIKMERKEDQHNVYVNNLHKFLTSVSGQFDVCLIDTNPNPDIRQLSALVCSQFVVSPIQLNQEAIDGIGDLLNHPSIGIRRIQETINPNLQLLGILPNIVEPTPFQRNNFHALAKHYAKLLIPLEKGFAAIKRTTAIPEAQAAGVPVWKLGKTSGREAWAQIKPIFEKLAQPLEAV